MVQWQLLELQCGIYGTISGFAFISTPPPSTHPLTIVPVKKTHHILGSGANGYIIFVTLTDSNVRFATARKCLTDSFTTVAIASQSHFLPATKERKMKVYLMHSVLIKLFSGVISRLP
jgi:hypothetical protein